MAPQSAGRYRAALRGCKLVMGSSQGCKQELDGSPVCREEQSSSEGLQTLPVGQRYRLGYCFKDYSSSYLYLFVLPFVHLQRIPYLQIFQIYKYGSKVNMFRYCLGFLDRLTKVICTIGRTFRQFVVVWWGIFLVLKYRMLTSSPQYIFLILPLYAPFSDIVPVREHFQCSQIW